LLPNAKDEAKLLAPDIRDHSHHREGGEGGWRAHTLRHRSAVATGYSPAAAASSGPERLPAAGHGAGPGRPRRSSAPRPGSHGRSHLPPAVPSPPHAGQPRTPPASRRPGRGPGSAPQPPSPRPPSSPWALRFAARGYLPSSGAGAAGSGHGPSPPRQLPPSLPHRRLLGDRRRICFRASAERPGSLRRQPLSLPREGDPLRSESASAIFTPGSLILRPSGRGEVRAWRRHLCAGQRSRERRRCSAPPSLCGARPAVGVAVAAAAAGGRLPA